METFKTLIAAIALCILWGIGAVLIVALLDPDAKAQMPGAEMSPCIAQYLDCGQKHIALDLAYNDCVRVLNGSTQDKLGIVVAEQLTEAQRITRRDITPFTPGSLAICQAYSMACDTSYYARLSQLRACRKTITQVEALQGYKDRGSKLGAYLVEQPRN